jgi:DNA-binding NtrC family response regulator
VVPSAPNNIKIRILIVDDEPDILFGLYAFFKSLGQYVKTFDKPEQVLECLASPDVHYDLVVADYRMPGGISGLDIAKQVKERTGKKTKVFLMTAFDVSCLPELSEGLNSKIIDEIIQKPISNGYC